MTEAPSGTESADPKKAPAFELSSGALCLDFANTIDDRPTRPIELLNGYDALTVWAEQAAVLPSAVEEALRAEAARRPAAAEAALVGARALREAIYAVFSAAAGGRPAPAASLAMLNAALPPSLARRRLVPDAPQADGRPGRIIWRWDFSDHALDGLLAPVVKSAADLLTSADLPRVRECEVATCGWLFVDRSRNRSRRWCDMAVCGNRAKARRYQARTRAVVFPMPETGGDPSTGG
ncbi:MAG: ABATE domain-containing protein [Acidobacteriota bacterium]|nr:ABATE domain-containing protein [Acidobacteriota bacterium]